MEANSHKSSLVMVPESEMVVGLVSSSRILECLVAGMRLRLIKICCLRGLKQAFKNNFVRTQVCFITVRQLNTSS